MALSDYIRIGWVLNLCLWNCNRCHAVVTDREMHDAWHAELAAHSHHVPRVIGGPGVGESVFRSAGQTHDMGPRPSITTAKPDPS